MQMILMITTHLYVQILMQMVVKTVHQVALIHLAMVLIMIQMVYVMLVINVKVVMMHLMLMVIAYQMHVMLT